MYYSSSILLVIYVSAMSVSCAAIGNFAAWDVVVYKLYLQLFCTSPQQPSVLCDKCAGFPYPPLLALTAAYSFSTVVRIVGSHIFPVYFLGNLEG